jgi:hypothetical protein
MDPAQLANEACKRFAALHASTLQASTVQASARQTAVVPTGSPKAATENRDPRDSGAEPLLEAFRYLATLDGWAKIAMRRLAVDPQDARAHQELHRSLEQAARLHPQFTRRLADVLADRPAVKTNLSTTGSLPLQNVAGRTSVDPKE